MSSNPLTFFAIRLLSCCLLTLAAPVHAAQIALNIADISAPSFAARGVQMTLPEDGSAELRVAELHLAGKIWHKVRVRCAGFSLSSARVTCRQGRLDAAPDLPFAFSYEFSSQRLELRLSAAANERWQVNADFRAQPWRVTARLRNAQGKRLAALLPRDWPLLTQGALNGTLEVRGDEAGMRHINAGLQLSELAFADASGLHAAEKLSGKLNFNATRAGRQWDWRGALDWQGGELFWQPLYLRGGHTLQASGQWDGAQLKVTQAVANLAEVGKVELTALWDVKQSELREGHLRGANLSLANAFAGYVKPFLEKGALAAAELAGRADVDWQYRNGATQTLLLKLHDASVTDGEQRFALHGINADIPWRAGAQDVARVAFAGGELMGLPLGAAQWQVRMRGLEFFLPSATLPVLDGAFAVRDFHMRSEGGMWQWDFSGALAPVSMRKLSAALHWPEMHGALSGTIPKVSYRDKTLKVDGALLFRVFDGTVMANHIELFDPFGRTPRLSANLDMRGLDLDLLTRTFSFGNMQGRIDVSVNGLELVNWQPVRFDAKLASSPGKYPKKISQKAVQNISELGGPGGAAALQRSYMSLFENFSYDRIGLSCALRNNVCTMAGVEGTGNTYVIVKGGGIPAINVIGYNRNVGWRELMTRLQRVLQDNRQAVVE